MMRKSDEAIKESEIRVAKFSYASLFGAMLLLGLIVTRWVWSTDWAIARYDALLIYKQAVMHGSEMRVIFLFHLTGTATR